VPQPASARTTFGPLAIVAVAALAQVYVGLPLFAGGLPVSSDIAIHFAEIAQIARSIEQGDFSLWNPMFNFGFVSGYYYQLLPQLAVALPYLLFGKLLPLLFLYKVSLVAPMVLLPLTTYRALRVAGVPALSSAVTAACAAFIYSTSTWGHGFDSMFTTGIWTQHWAMVFLPLALAYGAQWLVHERHLARALGYALLVGLCHPFIAIALGLVLPHVSWWRGHGGWLRGLGRGAVLAVLALAVSAFFWLPILVHYDAFGGFPARHLAEHGMSATEQLDLMVSGDMIDRGRLPILALGFALAVLLSMVPPWMAAVLRMPEAAQRPVMRVMRVCVGAAALFSMLMIVGHDAGKVGDDLAPMMRLIAPMQLALAVAAGLAFAMLGGWFWASFGRDAALPYGRWLRIAVPAAGVTALLTLLLVGAQHAHQHRVVTSDDYPVMHTEDLPAIAGFLADAPPGRYMAAGAWDTGTAPWLYHLAVYSGRPGMIAWGGAALQSSPAFRYLNKRIPGGIDTAMANVRYLIVSGPADKVKREDATEIFRAGDHAVLEVPATGYFRPVRILDAIPARPRQERFARFEEWMGGAGPTTGEYLMIGDRTRPEVLAIIDGADAPLPVARVLWEEEAPARYAAEVEVEGELPVTFAISVSYHPGWRMTIDGKPAPVLRLSPEILGASVPPGEHHVALALHRPRWPWLLLLLSAAIIALTARLPRRPRHC
jgi:hypothetical protein